MSSSFIYSHFQEKCDHYWPSSSDAVFYGDIQVAILNETVFPDWTITEFKVCLVGYFLFLHCVCVCVCTSVRAGRRNHS